MSTNTAVGLPQIGRGPGSADQQSGRSESMGFGHRALSRRGGLGPNLAWSSRSSCEGQNGAGINAIIAI